MLVLMLVHCCCEFSRVMKQYTIRKNDLSNKEKCSKQIDKRFEKTHFEVGVACMRSNVQVTRQTSIVVSPIPQVRINVGCQSWNIGPRLALLWRPCFGDHSWANCGSFGFTNFGSQHRQTKMCPTVSSTMAQTRTDCRANFGELLQMTVTVQSAHLWATVEPIVGILQLRIGFYSAPIQNLFLP